MAATIPNPGEVPQKADDQVVLLICRGRTDLFGELYDRYYKQVYFKCLTLSHNEVVAEDLTHDIFIKVFGNLSKYGGGGRFASWLNSVATNYCLDYLRRHKKLRLEDFTAAENHVQSAIDPGSIDEIRYLSLLPQALESLSESDRLMVIMKYYDGLKVDEIAQRLNIGRSAVKMRLARIREKLRIQIQTIENE